LGGFIDGSSESSADRGWDSSADGSRDGFVDGNGNSSKGEEHWKLESYAMVRMLKIRLLCFVVVAQKLRSRVVVKQEGHRRRSSEEGVMEIALAR
jgi:hypothetical protein